MVFYLFDLFVNVLKAGILWLLVVVVLCICRMFIRKGREAKSLNCGLLWSHSHSCCRATPKGMALFPKSGRDVWRCWSRRLAS